MHARRSIGARERRYTRRLKKHATRETLRALASTVMARGKGRANKTRPKRKHKKRSELMTKIGTGRTSGLRPAAASSLRSFSRAASFAASRLRLRGQSSSRPMRKIVHKQQSQHAREARAHSPPIRSSWEQRIAGKDHPAQYRHEPSPQRERICTRRAGRRRNASATRNRKGPPGKS